MTAKVLHFDCFSGVSGDMTLAALLDLGVPESIVQEGLASLGLDGALVVEKVRKNGFAATKIRVEAPPQNKHRHLSHILKILDQGKLSAGAKDVATRMFNKLGQAEAKSHGIAVEKVHFHEVGAVDSIYDFVGIAIAIDWLKPGRVTSRAVPTGCGFVKCDHGVLPVPPPAVANLLTGIPIAPSTIEAEMTTPTGAAVIATLVDAFTQAPEMTIEKVGHGAGTMDFPGQPNILRLFVGQASANAVVDPRHDVLWQLDTNVDDATPEQIGHALAQLWEAGAVDVFTTAVQMKKNRPGVLITVLCGEAHVPPIETILFRETGTFGVRKHQVQRSKLERKAVSVETPLGTILGKIGWNDDVRIFSPEFDDCSRIAQKRGASLAEVYRAATQAFHAGQPAE
jgi:uncharacterized protein (TIGR00299 family) protein